MSHRLHATPVKKILKVVHYTKGCSYKFNWVFINVMIENGPRSNLKQHYVGNRHHHDKIKTCLFPCLLDFGKKIVIRDTALDNDSLGGKVNAVRRHSCNTNKLMKSHKSFFWKLSANLHLHSPSISWGLDRWHLSSRRRSSAYEELRDDRRWLYAYTLTSNLYSCSLCSSTSEEFRALS